MAYSKTDCGRYTNSLLCRGHGFALWRPNPTHPHLDYRQDGLNIGDVGFITSDGAFRFLFNMLLPEDHCFQCHGVPEGYIPLQHGREVDEEPFMHDSMTCITSAHAKARDIQFEAPPGGGALGGSISVEVEASCSEGAALVLPKGGSRTNLLFPAPFRTYAAANAESWYRFVNGTLGCEIDNGSLYVVTGFDKCTSWGVSSWSESASRGNVSLKFTASTTVGGAVSYKWEDRQLNSVAFRSGPGTTPNHLRNQSAFVRGFKIAIPANVFSKLLRVKVRTTDLSETTGQRRVLSWRRKIPFPFQSMSRSKFYDECKTRNGSCKETEGCSEDVHPSPKPYHPLDVINKYLLDMTKASVAICHDDVWCSVMDSSDSIPPSDAELLRRVLSLYEVVFEGDVVSLRRHRQRSRPHIASGPNLVISLPSPRVLNGAPEFSHSPKLMMKMKQHQLSRRAEQRDWSETTLKRRRKRKALLVGIQYENDGEDSDGVAENPLRRPHQDVLNMRRLLIDYYGYTSEDIVILIDQDEPDQILPTRENMLREISTLVRDAWHGDHFFFYYAGRTGQMEHQTNNEEDGMDECIVPSDRGEGVITDNELRRHLLDTLPIDSSLVAIFDSCHSATLLDLEHFRCNRIYIPWKSKKKRHSDFKWTDNGVSSRHIYQNKRINTGYVNSRRTSIHRALYLSKDYRRLNIRTSSLSIKSNLAEWYDWGPSLSSPRYLPLNSMWSSTSYYPPMKLQRPNVISLSACKDDQVAWEDNDRALMTNALIKILKNDPHSHPTLGHLLTKIIRELHEYLHGHARDIDRTTFSRQQLRDFSLMHRSASPECYCTTGLQE